LKIKMVSRILEANDRIALENRKKFNEADVFVINLMSAPGAGKTSLIEQTIKTLRNNLRIGIIEGDIAGTDDAQRIEGLGIPVIQINTGSACHLDANMINDIIDDFPIKDLDLLIVENVGNLVCPAEFKIGEDMKCMILSVAEGDDKPLKYPLMFRESSALILNKIDLLPHIETDIEKIKRDSLSLNPSLQIFGVSCKTGKGLAQWTEWLQAAVKK